MREYQLHSASWSRIVDHRVRQPQAIAARLASRRRPQAAVPVDGQLMLLDCNQSTDPRTETHVERRELLDRIIEGLSIPDVDGVIASADLLEELVLLNVLEHRLAFCSASGDSRPGYSMTPRRGGVSAATIAASHFDGASLTQHWRLASAISPSQPWSVAADVAEFSAQDLPTILDLKVRHESGVPEFDTPWNDWVEPIHYTTSAIATGAGVWMTVPAITGLTKLAEVAGFPILIRDTTVPVDASAWTNLFNSELPLTVRGMVAGPSALFPLDGSVADATAQIAGSVRQRVLAA